MNGGSLLDVQGLTVIYPDGTKALDSVSFSLGQGEIVGLIGESGSGKSTLGLALLRLLPEKTQIKGSVMYESRDVLQMKQADLVRLRGREIGIVFQDTLSAFDPLFRVGRQITERMIEDGSMEQSEANTRAVKIMKDLGVTYPESRMNAFPHELSGGLRQRAFVTMTVFQGPKIIVMDEPTTALDVIAQIQLVDMVHSLKDKGISVIFITHDIVLASTFCDRLLILYAGKTMESGPTAKLIGAPKHPYTEGLIKATPTLSTSRKGLRPMPGNLPNPKNLPEGCRFRQRCPYADELCATDEPEEREIETGRTISCHYPEKVLVR